jgi:4-amino-4-deoxy-L-arabinose transferase-like glycosyltransferase
MSVAVAALFIGITLWWLTQDRGIPVFDAGVRLHQAIIVYEYLRSGNLGAALTTTTPYPPLSYLVGALGLWVGGIGIAPPIIAANLVFVSLLALGCYNVGRLAFGSRAGLLAVVFALGSPLITAQFHVFMTDAPEAAMVALAVWSILASERFSRVWISALAGVAVGVGLLSKEPFVFFVAGVVLVTLLRGGWRAWRGIVAFAAIALLIALPWYVSEFSQIHEVARGVATNQSASLGVAIAPHRWSLANLQWYASNILNAQLYAPLFLFFVVGYVWTIVGLVRRRAISPFSWELAIGVFVGWLGITATFPHDTRYSMPILVYLAVFGSGWVGRLPRVWRLAATVALVLVAIANTLSTSFGLGSVVDVKLPVAISNSLSMPKALTIYSNGGFLVAAPHRDGDVLGLMRALRRHGVREVWWINLGPHEPTPGFTPDFSEGGLKVFAVIARLGFNGFASTNELTASDALLGHGPVTPTEVSPCVTLSDGTGVWVRLGNPNGPGAKDYCPFRHPAFY